MTNPTGKMRTFEIIKLIAGIVSITCWFAWGALWNYYASHMSKIYNSQTGNINRLYSHGITVYITNNENIILTLIPTIAVMSLLITVLIHIFTHRGW
jgi:hypothetical protein